jgi:hypothetical protein
MEKTAITFADYQALDEKVENEIKEFLNKAYNHTWYIDTEVVLANGYLVRLVEIKLKDGEVRYVERNESGEESFIMEEMAYGQILSVRCCLPDEENFSRLNELLEIDAKYNINELLKKYPYYSDWGNFVRFDVLNDAVRLTNEYGIFDTLHNNNDFIKYVKNHAMNDRFRADFLQLMASIMELDDAESIWVIYGERIIAELRDSCGYEHYDSSVMRNVVSSFLCRKLLN